MRHSRKLVMKERYILYLRKHIFNGRYFERNLQLMACMVLVVALMIGCITVGVSAGNKKNGGTSVSVKEALFGSNEQTAVKTKKAVEIKDDTEAVIEDVVTVAARAETAAPITETATTEEIVCEATTEEPRLFADRCIANVEETLNIRMAPDSESEFVGRMDAGAIAVVDGTEGEWTKIHSGGVEGYVLTQYILTGAVAESFAKDYVILHGTILEDGVNIRSQKSTDSDIVTIMNTDDTLTVLEDADEEDKLVTPQTAQTDEVVEEAAEDVESEDTDEITWVHVRLEDGQEGYVSADLIDIDELYQVAVSAEELRRQEEEAARKAAEEEAARYASRTTKGNGHSGQKTPYQGAVITPITAATSGESLGIFTITAYCGCTKCSGGSNLTATGTVPTQGRTIAADTGVLPYGSQVVIDGIVYTVEDCGSGVRGNHIDIFFATHEQAMAFGRKSMEVFKY